MIPRRLAWALLAVLLWVLVGTAGYWIIGAGRWALGDCLYMTVTTVSTAGFGEILPVGTTPWGRPFTMFLLTGGVLTVGWLVATAVAAIIEGELSGLAWRRRMDNRVKQMSDHVVVCGAGSTGIHCIQELAATGTPFVVVERQEALARELSRAHGCAAVVGDATHDEFLLEAGIERARGCISALTEDKDNLFVIVTARALNPQLRIVAKAIDPSAIAKLKRAGADGVVSPNMIGGQRLVAEMLRPEVVSFLDEMVRDPERTLRIEEVPIPEGSPILGRRVADLALASHGLLLLALRPAKGGSRFLYNPEAGHALEGGETLIVLGEPDRVRKLSAEVAAR